MDNILLFYLIVELVLLVLLCNKYRTPNALVLSYLIFILYAQSNYLDFLISGNYLVKSSSYFSLNFSIDSSYYFLASSYYFFFLLIFGFLGLSSNYKIILNNFSKAALHDLNSKRKTIIVLCCIYVLYFHLLTFGFDRTAKKTFDIFTYDFIIFYYLFYSWGYELIYAKKKNIFFYFMTFVISLHTIFSFEREFLVLTGLFLLFKYKKYFKRFKILIISTIALFIINIWKEFYTNVIIFSMPLEVFFKEFSFNQTFSSGETTTGMSLLTNFFENDIYKDYYFSYLRNTINQFVRIFADTNYLSLGEFSSKYYTNSNMGTAFSMILESILNFGFMAPLILPFLILYFLKHLLKRNIYYMDFYSVFFVFLILKLVRTEFTVILKLYVLPFLLFVFLNNFLKKNKYFLK